MVVDQILSPFCISFFLPRSIHLVELGRRYLTQDTVDKKKIDFFLSLCQRESSKKRMGGGGLRTENGGGVVLL